MQLLICELNKSAFKAVARRGVPPSVVVMNQDNEESSHKRQRDFAAQEPELSINIIAGVDG